MLTFREVSTNTLRDAMKGPPPLLPPSSLTDLHIAVCTLYL